MAALTADSWTVDVTERGQKGDKRYAYGTLTLEDTNTYPTGGIPLPAKGKFGFIRQMNELRFIGESGAADQYLTNYDPTNHTMLFYEEEGVAAAGPLLECDTSEVPGAAVFHFYAEGW